MQIYGPRCAAAGTTLYSQFPEGHWGYNSTHMPSSTSGYQLCAENFQIYTGAVWEINKVIVKSPHSYDDPIDFTVKFMQNENGKPGAVISEYNVNNVHIDAVTFNWDIALPTPQILNSGIYWVCVYGNNPYPQFFWECGDEEFGLQPHRYRPPDYPYWRPFNTPHNSLSFAIQGQELHSVPFNMLFSLLLFGLIGLGAFFRFWNM